MNEETAKRPSHKEKQMGTPQAVLDAEAEADRLIAEMGEGGDGTSATGEGSEDQPISEGTGEDQDKSLETPPADAKPKDTDESATLRDQVADLTEKLRVLTAQHDTLRGKTYAEVPRVLTENKALRDELTALKEQIAAQSAAPGAISQSSKGKAAEILARLKGSVNEEVVDDIYSLAQAIADERVSERVTQVEGRVETLRKSAVEEAEDRYIKSLTEFVPDWSSIAGTPQYSEFLGTREELSGRTYYELATEALERLDAKRMSAFYNTYKKRAGIAQAEPAPTGTREVPKGKEALIAPKGSARTVEREQSGGQPDYITAKQLEQFNRDMKTMSAEAEAKLQARIDRAIQNHWIVP